MSSSPQPDNRDPAIPSTLRALFRHHDFRPRKSLGQHFLVEPNVADHIIRIARIEKEDRILEIGAGAGALTVRLAKAASDTIAVEIDKHLQAILSELLQGNKKVKLIQTDIMKVDLTELLGQGRWKVLGNLPYYITGPIIGKLLKARHMLASIVLMLQEEVANRIVSAPQSKEYGALSVLVQTFFEPRREMKVKRGCFFPVPEVDSAIISLTSRPTPLIEEELEEKFQRVVHAAFSHRRKKLENSLVDAEFVDNREVAVAALKAANIGAGRRAETLSVQEFVKLTRYLPPEKSDA